MISVEKVKLTNGAALLHNEVPEHFPLPTEKCIKHFRRHPLKCACLCWQQSAALKFSPWSCADIPGSLDGERQGNKYSHYGPVRNCVLSNIVGKAGKARKFERKQEGS